MGGSIFQASYQATLTGSQSEACGSGLSNYPDTLSQWGSQNCASAYRSWQSILSIYYPGVLLHTPTAYAFWEGMDGALWQAKGPANGALGSPQRRGYHHCPRPAPDATAWGRAPAGSCADWASGSRTAARTTRVSSASLH